MALGDAVIVPVINPASATWLGRLAGLVARPDRGTVVPLSVVALDANEPTRNEAFDVIASAEEAARLLGARAAGQVVRHRSVVAAVGEAATEHAASLLVMGWRGDSSRGSVFGELIDTIVGRSRVPLAIIRPQPEPFRRILLPITAEHLLPAGLRSVGLAADLTRRLQTTEDCPIVVLHSNAGSPPLPAELRALADTIDERLDPPDRAVAALAQPHDLVVSPVAPTAEGLRSATARLAAAAPEAWLLVAVDVGPVGPARTERDSASPPQTIVLEPMGSVATYEHVVAVTFRPGSTLLEPAEVGRALCGAGLLVDLESWEDDSEEAAVQATLRVAAPSPTAAVSAVMTVVHDTDSLRDAEISYAVLSAR